MDLIGSRRTDSSNPTKYQTLEVEGGFYALAAGRVGFAWNHTLVYGKGGWAYYDGEATQTTTNPGFVTHGTGALYGWAYGGGIEQVIGNGWSLKGEYLHFDFDAAGGDQTGIEDGYVFDNTSDVDSDTVKLGINLQAWDPGIERQLLPTSLTESCSNACMLPTAIWFLRQSGHLRGEGFCHSAEARQRDWAARVGSIKRTPVRKHMIWRPMLQGYGGYSPASPRIVGGEQGEDVAHN